MADDLDHDLAQARAGDQAAFARIVERHAPGVYRIAASIAGESEAEDVAQEVFVRLHQGLSGFRGDAAIGTWIHRVTVNAALTSRARTKRREEIAKDAAPELAVSASQSTAAPDAGLEQDDRKRRVWKALEALPDEQRAVVVLREIEGLPFEDVARTLGIKKPTAESRMARARARLRELLGGSGAHD